MIDQEKIPGIPPSINGSKASDTAVVVLSGGQDSVTCLGVALAQHEKVVAVSFLYGQKHNIELKQAAFIADGLGVPHSLIDLSFFGGMVTSELTSADGDTTKEHAYKAGLPASFVPNRNALFLTLAHAVAQEVGASTIYGGMCETDYSGYPDCREEFIQKLETALNVGYETNVQIKTPLMHLTKAETFALAERVGILPVVISHSHTCYNGDREHVHDWGHGCGKCPACELRKKGYNEFIAQRAA